MEKLFVRLGELLRRQKEIVEQLCEGAEKQIGALRDGDLETLTAAVQGQAGLAAELAGLEDARRDNARADYVLFFAWAYSKSYLHYYRREKPDVLRAALKILFVIRYDFLRFNDDCTQEFVSLLIRHAGADEAGAEAEIAREPVVPEAEELIKFVATFVTDLKRRHGLPIRLY